MSAAPQPRPLRVANRLAGVSSSPVRDLLALTRRPEVISFAGGLPAPETFDVPGLQDAFAAVTSDRAVFQYGETEGVRELRDRLAARLTERGVRAQGDDVLVTAGSQQALTLVAAALLDPGDVVLVEQPTYLAALQVFQLAGARLVAVPGDEDGPDPAAVERAALEHGAKVLHVIPTFQNPTGRTIPVERRRALLDAAARTGLWLIEDDPYSELRFAGEFVPPLGALPGAEERTIVLGSLSKVLAPGLRIGYLKPPAQLSPSLAVAKQAADLHTPTITQAAAARWLADADLEAHLEAVRALYRERRDAILDALTSEMPAGTTWTEPEGGMFTWVTLPPGHDASALLPRALDADVAFVPGVPFYPGEPDPRTLRLSFSEPTPDRIAEGIRRLASVL
ncbi:MAG TPA: PLP-dependent aminotransferase family protein [Solirubrobacteraceae bacterium]|nr:PLP-dependent aminotransferase family protein [Solirubrobacteraceae bacterium]